MGRHGLKYYADATIRLQRKRPGETRCLIQQRPSGAAPLGSKDFYEKVNPYWLDQGARLKHQATSRKRQAASDKLDKE